MIKVDKLKLWLPVLLWCGVIFSLSSLSIKHGAEFSWLDFVVKKTAHVTEYAILYWLTYRAMSKRGKLVGTKYLIYPLIFSMIYALSDEWHQTFVMGREGTLRDVGFDTLGALISLSQIKKNL